MKKKGINLIENPPPKIEIKEEDKGEKIPIKVKIPKQEVLLDLDRLNSPKAENKIISQEIIEPPLDFSGLKSDYNNKNNNIININNKYRLRIRMNRNKKISVDRYIQSMNSMDPFDDSYNENIINYGKYNPNLTLNSLSYNCFENLLKNYYQQKYKFLDYIIDKDDDYDSFFKSKKSNKRLLSKKRGLTK